MLTFKCRDACPVSRIQLLKITIIKIMNDAIHYGSARDDKNQFHKLHVPKDPIPTTGINLALCP